MKIALCTTTINVPHVLKHYARDIPHGILGVEVCFFVAGDLKTPTPTAYQFMSELGICRAFVPEEQKQWKHSEFIGWNTDSRRNIAVLEALRWGADLLISVDDDMLLQDDLIHSFFLWIKRILTQPFSGLQMSSRGWFDAGQFTIPPARQRGLPPETSQPEFFYADSVQIGAMQGIILGTPDTDAATTIANRPLVHSASDILKAGFVVDPNTKAVFNSQITAFRRELAPAFAQFYKWQGRNTDIIASLIMRRIMRDRNLHTYFGPPTGFHARAPRDPLKDLNAEMWGLNKIREFQDYLENTSVFPPRANEPVTKTLRRLYEDMLTFDMFPRECVEAMLAWLDDCESVL